MSGAAVASQWTATRLRCDLMDQTEVSRAVKCFLRAVTDDKRRRRGGRQQRRYVREPTAHLNYR